MAKDSHDLPPEPQDFADQLNGIPTINMKSEVPSVSWENVLLQILLPILLILALVDTETKTSDNSVDKKFKEAYIYNLKNNPGLRDIQNKRIADIKYIQHLEILNAFEKLKNQEKDKWEIFQGELILDYDEIDRDNRKNRVMKIYKEKRGIFWQSEDKDKISKDKFIYDLYKKLLSLTSKNSNLGQPTDQIEDPCLDSNGEENAFGFFFNCKITSRLNEEYYNEYLHAAEKGRIIFPEVRNFAIDKLLESFHSYLKKGLEDFAINVYTHFFKEESSKIGPKKDRCALNNYGSADQANGHHNASFEVVSKCLEVEGWYFPPDITKHAKKKPN